MNRNHGVEREAWSRRPHYTPRQRLTADQLNTGLLDELERQQIINQAIHGFGVVMGYGLALLEDGTLDLRHGQLKIGDGLALDRYGRMLVWKRGCIGMDDLVGPQPREAGWYTLVAHNAVRSPEAEDCTLQHGTHSLWTEETVVFSLHPGCEERECGCPEHPSESCVSHGEYMNRRSGGLPGKASSVAPSPDVESFLKRPSPPRASGDGGWAYDVDPRVGVPLACVKICDLARDHGNKQVEAPPDETGACDPRCGFCPDSEPKTIGVRPLVYRNPLLYELTRCCDMDAPRVKEISWQGWVNRGWKGDGPVAWDDFADAVSDRERGFAVWFTKPVDPATLHEASFFITAFYQDDDAAWRSYRIPAGNMVPVGHSGKVDVARLIPDQREWLRSEVSGKRSHLFDGCRIEVTIRGQLVRDECGRMLDARPIGLDCDTHCQSRPGADFVTVFQVAARQDDQQVPAQQAARKVGE
jgi:hypothetical protein